MNDLMLSQLIRDTFGSYPKPAPIGGVPREGWQDRLEQIPLEDIELKDLREAVWHIFPGHYGDIGVFRYLMRRILPFFLSIHENAADRSGDRECERDMEYHPDRDTLSVTALLNDIVEMTGRRCAQWRSRFSPAEVDTVNEVFRYACYSKYRRNRVISSFDFTLFLLWERDYNDLFLYFGKNYDARALEDLRARVNGVIRYFGEIPESSVLLALLGIYYNDARYKPILIQQGEAKIHSEWFDESIDLLPVQVRDYFSPDEITIADRKILEFIADSV